MFLNVMFSDSKSVDRTFNEIEKLWGKIDFVVHAIGFSDKNELDGRYIDTTEKNFINTLNISCYSFTAVASTSRKINEGWRITLNPYLLWC